MTETGLKVIVVGAGIGGLSTAIALQRKGHRVEIYERTETLRPIGAALSIWPNGVKILNALGLRSAIAAASGSFETMSYRDHHGQLLTTFSLNQLYQDVGESARPISRSTLQRILLDAVGRETVHLGQACVSFEQNEHAVTIELQNGATATGDALIVCDGSRSSLRNAVVGETVERHYRGYVNWNGLVASSPRLSQPLDWLQFVGEGKRVSLMPAGNGKSYFFFDVCQAPGSANHLENYRHELKAHFRGWCEPVQRLIDELDVAGVARVEIYDTDVCRKWVDGRVALLGDAAHAMTPDLGQGGCQALEDAWVLAEQLGHADFDIASALLQYQDIRIDRATDIVRRARKRAELIHGLDAAETQDWYRELASQPSADILAGLKKTTLGSPLR